MRVVFVQESRGSQLIKQKSKVLKRNEEAKNATLQRQRQRQRRQLKLQKERDIKLGWAWGVGEGCGAWAGCGGLVPRLAGTA